MICRHLDGNKANNRLSNLVWGTYRENEADKLRHGTRARGESHGCSRLKEWQVVQIRQMAATGCKQQEIATAFGVDRTMISLIVRRKNWCHI
jgi:hypothetical protein